MNHYSVDRQRCFWNTLPNIFLELSDQSTTTIIHVCFAATVNPLKNWPVQSTWPPPVSMIILRAPRLHFDSWIVECDARLTSFAKPFGFSKTSTRLKACSCYRNFWLINGFSQQIQLTRSMSIQYCKWCDIWCARPFTSEASTHR